MRLLRLDTAGEVARFGLALGVAAGTAVCGLALWHHAMSSPAASEADVVVAAGAPPLPLAFPLPDARPVLRDSFDAPRSGGRVHRAIDMMAPRGTRVVAVADGRITRMSREGAGGIAVYQVDASGRYGFYYAHLDAWAPGLAEGATVRAGDAIGVVGSTGNADARAPHLHFAAWEVTDPAAPAEGRPLNPYTFWRVERRAAD